MDLTAIPDLRVDSAGDEVTYRLPARPMGALRIAGLLPIGFSALWVGILAKTFWPTVHNTHSAANGMNWILPAVLLLFAAVGLGPAFLGLGLMFGRIRIQWRDRQLAVINAVGPFVWRRRLSKAEPRKLAVIGVNKNAAALFADFESGPRRMVVAGYPQEWLEAIARDLSARAGLLRSDPAAVEVFTGADAPLPAPQAAVKPPGTRVTLQHNNASTVLEVPPLGLIKGSMGLFFFGLFWCAFTGAITFAMLTAKPQAGPGLFLAVFWLVGLGMLAIGINLGRRRATLTAGPSGLIVIKSSPFGVKRLEYRRGDIATVGVGPSNMKVNNKTLPELKIHLNTGKHIGVLSGHAEDELRWIAMELEKGLGISTTALSTTAATTAPLAALSARQPQRSPAGLAITVAIAVIFFASFFGFRIKQIFVSRHSSPTASTTIAVKTKFDPPPPGMAFNSFGPGGSHSTNAWFIGRQAHADWFVPAASGFLSEIELAMEPNLSNPRPGKLTVTLAPDQNGHPGPALETFTARPDAAFDPVFFESVKHPMLQAGAKYWLCAKSAGAWSWHFNDQQVAQNAARSLPHNQWASAGDYCYVCAFSVGVSTNTAPRPAIAPTAANAESGTNQ